MKRPAKCEIPCGTPEAPSCPCAHAAERGLKDGTVNRLEVAAGRGMYRKDDYPSNPYHKSSPSHSAYNQGWNEAWETAV